METGPWHLIESQRGRLCFLPFCRRCVFVKAFKRKAQRSLTKGEGDFRLRVLDVLTHQDGTEHQVKRVVSDKEEPPAIYVLCFYLPQHKICIEIDGASRKGAEIAQRDAVRDSFLARCGIKTLRFTNQAVKSSPESCLQAVRRAIEQRRRRVKVQPVAFAGSRESDLAAQEAFIKDCGVTKCPTVGPGRKIIRYAR